MIRSPDQPKQIMCDITMGNSTVTSKALFHSFVSFNALIVRNYSDLSICIVTMASYIIFYSFKLNIISIHSTDIVTLKAEISWSINHIRGTFGGIM